LDYISLVPPPLPPNPSIFFLMFDFAFVVSIPSKFFHYYFCAPCNTATFHALGCSDLTIAVDDLGMTTIFKHFLCAMFTFQPCSLHISKDVSYDYNIFFSSSLYHIPTTSSQGRQWVVRCGCYRIVGDSLVHNSWEIIFIIGIIGSIIKISVKQEFKVDVLMLLYLLFSLNYVIPPQVRTWHPFFHCRNCQKTLFNLMPLCHQSCPPLWGVFNLLSLVYAWWCCQDKPQMNYKLWIMTRSLCKKFNSCRLFSMGMFC
jgi:hypothetical protein